MPRIFYTANNYTGLYAHLNTEGEQYINCKKLDIYRAIITVGNPSFLSWETIRKEGLFRALSNSIIQKILLVQANIESTPNGMALHPSFYDQISDFKRVISYNLGMAFAKIYAERLLEIPNLIHVELLKKNDAITFHNTDGKRREPDLVGLTTDGSWHVFEAKGISTNQLNRKIVEAKEQAREVDRIQGHIPSTLSACATYFSVDRILSRIEDPESKRKKRIKIQTSKYFEIYYNSFFAFKSLLDEKPKKKKIENINYYQYKIKTNKLNITIGLDEEVYDLIREKNFQILQEALLKKRKKWKKEKFIDAQLKYSIGIDGFLVMYTNF